jgi:exosortase
MDNGHGLFMPFVAAYLVREQLRSDPVEGERASAAGFAFVIPGLAMLALDTGIRSELMAAVGLVVILPGLSLLLLGARRTRALGLPLLIAAMMLPVPAGAISQLHLVLRQITAVVVEQIVPLVGPPISRDGTLLQLPHSLVSVADACSGFGTLYASVATALILGHLVRTRRRRLTLLAACVPIALLTNWVRVSALVLLAHHVGPEVLQTRLHEGTGFAAFVVALVVLFAIAGREVLPDPDARPVRTPVSARYALPLLALCALALVPVARNVYAQRRIDDCAHPVALVPGSGIHDPERRAQREREMREQFEAFAFREGVLRARDRPDAGADLAWSIVRTFDPKRVYYRPEYWLSGHGEAIESGIDPLDVAGRSLPLHRVRLETRGEHVHVAGYLLVYGGEPVADGMRAQLAAAPQLMLRGPRPMTLYYAQALSAPDDLEATSDALARWLAASWKQYAAICGAAG